MIVHVFIYPILVLTWVAPHLARARGKVLGWMNAAKLPLAAARKLSSIVCCKCDDAQDIKMNVYLHYQVVIIKAELRNASNACRKVVELGASKTIILVDVCCCNSMTARWIAMNSCINDIHSIVNEAPP